MVPEISHRCPSCGASIRGFGTAALFCPECGKALAETKAETTAPENSIEANNPEEAELVASPEAGATEAPVADTHDGTKEVSDAPVAGTKAVTDDRHRARERTRETLQRASTMARGAVKDNVKRVEKIHHVSSVMLEEATYDPSLRFVLVALGLFVAFVILLVLSKVMG